MMLRNAPAFDLDGTLVQTLDLILANLASYGFEVSEKRDQFNFDFVPGREPPPYFLWDLFFYRIFTEQFDQIDPIDDYVHDFLRLVQRETNQPVRVITARPDGALIHYTTNQLLLRCFPDVDFSVEIVDNSTDKHQYLYGHHVFFDDRRKTVKDLKRRGYFTFMRDDVYNKLDHASDFVHVKHIKKNWISPLQTVVYDSFKDIMTNNAILDFLFMKD